MPSRRNSTTKARPFRLIDPRNPPNLEAKYGRLGLMVAELATWFASDPKSIDDRRPRQHDPASISLSELEEAIDAAHSVLKERLGPSIRADEGEGEGAALVNAFCDRYISHKPTYELQLRSGRRIGQRQVLCAFGLLLADEAAVVIQNGESRELCNLMHGLLEITCEVRRALDREAGSSIASRRARKRHERTYLIRAKAYELFDATPPGSVMSRSGVIYEEISRFAASLGAPLTPTRGPITVYNWLRAYKNASTPAQHA
jgi:hypothetical protein